MSGPMSGWRSGRAWGPGLMALVCAAGLALAQVDSAASLGEASERREPALSEEGRALLGELSVGDRIMGWTVQSLDGPIDGALRVDVVRDDVRFALLVVPVDARPESPPVSTERYAIFYGFVHPPETVLPEGTIRATTHALARRVRAHEAEVEVPGL